MVRGRFGIAVVLGGARVHEAGFAAADDGADGGGVVGVVEIAEDDEAGVGIRSEDIVNFLAEDFGFFEAHVGLGGCADGPLGFQMRGDEGEAVIGGDGDVHFGETAADLESLAVEEVSVVGLWAARGDGESAEDANVDIGIEAGDVFPIRQGEAVALECGLQFEQDIRLADFFERENIGFQRENTFENLGFGGVGFCVARAAVVVEIIFYVISGDAEGLGGGQVEAEK